MTQNARDLVTDEEIAHDIRSILDSELRGFTPYPARSAWAEATDNAALVILGTVKKRIASEARTELLKELIAEAEMVRDYDGSSPDTKLEFTAITIFLERKLGEQEEEATR